MNFEKGFPETIAQHVIWNLIVVQIKGEFKFIELGMQRTHRGVALYTVFDENGTHRGTKNDQNSTFRG